MISQIREDVQALHSALRRRKGDSTTQTRFREYSRFLKKTKKNAKKLMVRLKHMEARFGAGPFLNPDHHLGAVVRVVREVTAMSVCVLHSLLSFLARGSQSRRRSRPGG